MHAHPVIAAHRGSGDSSPAAISDLLTRRAWHANPLWVEAFAELEVEDQLSTGLIADGARLIGLSINRSRRGFSAADRAILDLARPAIAAALDVVATRERDGALIAQLAAVTEADGLGVAVVDEQGRVLEASPGALALLAAWLDATDHVALDRSLTDLRRRADRRLRIRTRPHPTRPGHTIVILREELEDLTATGIRLGLRPREAEAIALAAEGLTNAQIAARMGITPNTVRTHLERVHETLGVARRMAAVARLRAAALEQAR
jgi:DNA-binding CsgD family transcriptional regulator